jgi:hypothetical protein
VRLCKNERLYDEQMALLFLWSGNEIEKTSEKDGSELGDTVERRERKRGESDDTYVE